MTENQETTRVCSLCESEISKDDDFCPDCGTLFTEFVKCRDHSSEEAKGICVICCEPFCEECGSFIDDVFFCAEHSGYDSLEGKVILFKTEEAPQMELIRDRMEQDGLHPLIVTVRDGCKAAKILTLHASDEATPYTLLHLMVPFQEVIRAEEILRELELSE